MFKDTVSTWAADTSDLQSTSQKKKNLLGKKTKKQKQKRESEKKHNEEQYSKKEVTWQC
jgi:hypothetical protein